MHTRSSLGTNRTRSRRLLAACAVAALLAAFFTISARAQQPADSGFRIYPLLYASPAVVEAELLRALSALPERPEVITEYGNQRVLVRGPSRAHQITEHVLGRLDHPSQIARREPSAQGGIATARPPSQAVAPARARAAAMVPQRVAQAPIGVPPPIQPPRQNRALPPTTPYAPVAPVAGEPNQSLPGAHVVALRHVDFLTMHRSLEQLLGRPLPTTEDHASGTVRFVLEASPGDRVAVQANHRTGQLVMMGRPALVASWARVVQVLDRPPGTRNAVSRLMSVKHSRPDKVRQALTALTMGSSPAARVAATGGGQAAQMLASLMQSGAVQGAGAEAGTNAGQADQAGAAQQPAGEGADAQPAASGLMGPVQIEVLEGTDQIIIMGHERDVQRVMQLIAELEQISQTTVPVVQVYMLRHVNSEAMAALAIQVYSEVYETRQGPVSITSLGKPNAILVIGRDENVKAVAGLVDELDKPVDPKTQFRTFQLKHAPALEAQATIDRFFNPAAQGQAVEGTDRPDLATRLIAVADVRSNSLMVRASPRDMVEVEAMIARLDTATSASINEI